MTQQYEESYLKVLRWMRENLYLSSNIYRTQANAIAISPSVSLDGEGNPVMDQNNQPGNVANWFMNSVAALASCCYMDALGKVAQRGNRNYALNNFAQTYMLDFIAECGAKGGEYSVGTLYTVYRCGFAHQFASGAASWGRQGSDNDYWFAGPNQKPGLNVDRLVDGVLAGIDRFEESFDEQAEAGNATYEDFFEWLDQ